MLGVALCVAFAGLVGLASIFSRRGLERESFDVMLVTSLAVASPMFLVLGGLTTGFVDMSRSGVAYALLGGVIGSVVGRALYLLGIEYVGPGKSLSVNATSSLYVAGLSAVVLGEAVTASILVGTVVIFLGVVGISRDTKTEAERTGRSPAVILIPLAGAGLLAVSIILRKLALDTGLAPIEVGAVNMTVGLVVAGPLLVARRGASVTGVDRTALRYFVLASTLMAVAFVFYFRALKQLPASVFYPLIQTQPLFAVGFSALLLGDLELVTWRTGAGATCVVVGASLVALG